MDRRQRDDCELKLKLTTVRFRNPVNIGDHRSWVMSQGVVVEKEPVEWGFSQKA